MLHQKDSYSEACKNSSWGLLQVQVPSMFSKGLRALKFFLLLVHRIIRNTAMQHLGFMTMSFTLHHMLGSCSGADGHEFTTMYGTPSRTISQSSRREGKKTHLDLLICVGGGGPLPQSDLRKHKRKVTLLRVSLAIFNCWWDVTLGPTMGRTNHWLTTICCTDEHWSMQLQSSCSWLQTSSHTSTSGWHSQTNSTTTVSTFQPRGNHTGHYVGLYNERSGLHTGAVRRATQPSFFN
jgi:hypothetical protein